ncbi:MAG: ATP-binding cassette domain-containing protein [Clostridia bacterium]|nr:ATP-binding cassette domain-containing protein [Clostridia bacterium]
MSLEVQIRRKLGSFELAIDLEHQEGSTAILGASGSGKSVTLQAIAGVLRPDAGRIVLNGRVLFDSSRHIDLPPQQRHVGFLFQNYALFPNMTVLDNVACGAPRGLTRRQRLALAADWIRTMQLDGFESRYPRHLSGGQQQRTALARALIGQPEILMLDEPFSALDAQLREQLIPELRKLLDTWEKDALLVTHSRDEAYELCSTMAVLDNGRLVRYGPVQEVFDNPQTMAAAALTGCKNVTPACKAGPHTVFVPDWGIHLETARAVEDHLKGVGIRAHYFSPGIAVNAFPVEIVEEVEEPFAWILKFRYAGQSPESPAIWWRLSKDRQRTSRRDTAVLGVEPHDVLLLYT